jgi:hypothetical protein
MSMIRINSQLLSLENGIYLMGTKDVTLTVKSLVNEFNIKDKVNFIIPNEYIGKELSYSMKGG